MYYAHYNEEGNYIGFYTEEIHGSNIPTPTVVLNKKQWSEALTGDYKVIEGVHTYSPIVISQEVQLEHTLQRIRDQRNELLKNSDWTQLVDSPLTSYKKTQWKTYRQELRDITNTEDLTNVEFPLPPQ